MSLLASLLAAVNPDLIQIVVILIIAVVAGIAKFLAAVRQAQPPPGVPRPQPPPRPVPANVADEIDEFLRRAAQRRGVPPAQPATGGMPAPPPPAATPGRPLVPPPQPPIQAEVVGEAGKPVGGQVTEHVQKYLDAQSFTRRAGELGEEVTQAVQEVDQHLHQVFDHSVSQLAAVPGEAAVAPVAAEPLELTELSLLEIPATFATGLSTLLSDPDSLRQGIVLGEIFRRPEERWA